MSVNKEEVVFEQRVQLEIVLLYFHCTSELCRSYIKCYNGKIEDQ